MQYRLYRLRRLVTFCVLAVIAGLAIGVWLAGFAGPLAQPMALGALFLISSAALVAMTLRWPRDISTPLSCAVGTTVMLAALIPFGIYIAATDTRQEVSIVLAVMFGPLIWLMGAPLLGLVLLFPLDLIMRRNHTITSHHYLPMPPDMARQHFSVQPDTASILSTSGPVGWDGFWEERSVSRAPDPKNGQIIDMTSVLRIRELASDAMSQSILGVLPSTEGAARGMPTSFVMHISFAPDGAGTRMVRQTSIDQTSLGRLFTAWLSDADADMILAECDAIAGDPPRALIHLPIDSLWTTLQRFFRWDDRATP